MHELFTLSKDGVAENKYRKYQFATFQNDSLMSLIYFDGIDTRAVGSSKTKIDMQYSSTTWLARDHESEA